MKYLLLTSICLTIGLTACSSHVIEDYQHTKPKFDFEQYFLGLTKGYGQVFDRSGRLIRRFTADFTGSKEAEKFILDEVITYDDGEVETRTWVFIKQDDNTYVGTGDGIVGQGIGKQYGNAFQLKYVLTVKTKKRDWDISFDDWMFLHSEEILVNRAKMTKFGINVGEVYIVYLKP